MEKNILLSHKFCNGEYQCDIDGSQWKSTFEYILKNKSSMNFKKNKIHTLWTVNGGHLRMKIKDDALVAQVLSIVLPNYNGIGLELYRGECLFLYEENKIGFCWTPKKDVAKKFARGINAIESGGVLLKAYAPAISILAEPNEHSIKQMGEFEYTCDPSLLKNIEVVELFQKVRL